MPKDEDVEYGLTDGVECAVMRHGRLGRRKGGLLHVLMDPLQDHLQGGLYYTDSKIRDW